MYDFQSCKMNLADIMHYNGEAEVGSHPPETIAPTPASISEERGEQDLTAVSEDERVTIKQNLDAIDNSVDTAGL